MVDRQELKSHLLNMYMVALSDDDFDQTEMDVLIKIAADRGFTREQFESVILDPASVVMKIPEGMVEKLEALFDFAKVIWADGKVKDSERKALHNFCEKFGFQENEVASELTEWLLQLAKEDISKSDLKMKINELINS